MQNNKRWRLNRHTIPSQRGTNPPHNTLREADQAATQHRKRGGTKLLHNTLRDGEQTVLLPSLWFWLAVWSPSLVLLHGNFYPPLLGCCVAVWCPSLRVSGGSLIPRSLVVAWLLGPPLVECWVEVWSPSLRVLRGTLVPLS